MVGEPFDNLATCAALLERLKRPADSLEFRRARVQAVPWDQAAQIALARSELAAAAGADGADVRADAFARLARVAESPAVRYSVRVEAARAFASANGSLGRAPRSEIDWLRAPAALSPSAVEQPMFVDARLGAAQRATEPSTRVTLLLAALAVDPSHAGLRIPLFRAELAAGKAADALEALSPILGRSRGLNGLGLTATDRTRLALEMGRAYEQTDQLPQAVQFFTIALDGEPAAARPALNRRIASLNDEIARRARNAARRPQISQSLDQPQLVRPLIPPKPVPAAAQGAGR